MIDRVGIGLAFAALTCWPVGVLAQDLPPWPMTQEEIDAFVENFIAEGAKIPPAPVFYGAQNNPTVLVQEHRLPDFNGDGVEDLIMASGDPFGVSNLAGKVILYSGWMGESTLFEFTSEEIHDGYASVVKGLDDIDGDLIDDFAIGAPLSDLGAQAGGRVDVHSGATGALILRVVGNEANGRLGISIDNAGDCNGDGINDLVIGEPHTDAVRGRAFVFYGADGLGAGGTVLRSPADADLSLTDGLASAQFGLSVAGVGDVNGDGVPDLAIGSPGRSVADPDNIDDGLIDRVGGLRVFTGSTGDRLFTVNGSIENAWLGKAALGVADLDGDGINELFFSAPGFPFTPGADAGPAPVGPPTTDGHVYVLNSTDIAALAPNAALTVSDASYELARPAGAAFQFGDSMEIGHDVNGDGVDDILIYASKPVPVTVEELGGIDLAALGIPLTLPLFTLAVTAHVFSGSDASALYSYVSGDGSGVEIKIPYPGPVVAEQTSQVAPIGDTTLDGVVNADDLAQTVGSVGQPATSSPTTDVNQNGVTDVVDVGVVINIIDVQEAEIDCRQLIENGLYNDVCECFKNEFPDLDLSSLSDPEAFDCAGGDDPGPPGVDDGGGNNQCDVLPKDNAQECLVWATCQALVEAQDQSDQLDSDEAANDEQLANSVNAMSDALAAAQAQSENAARAAIAMAEAAIRATTNTSISRSNRDATIAVVGGAIAVLVTGGGAAPFIAFYAVSGASTVVVLFHDSDLSGDAQAAIDFITQSVNAASIGDGSNSFGRPPGVSGSAWAAVTNAAANMASVQAGIRSALSPAVINWGIENDRIKSEREALQQQIEERRDALLQQCLDGLDAGIPTP